MIKYPIFYRHYGTRLLKHLVNPRVIDASTLEFPVRSVFYNYMVSDVATDISKDDIYVMEINLDNKDSKATFNLHLAAREYNQS